jgi:hypothetical protein
VNFSEAMDVFVIIFQIPGPNCKIMDCGLILKKLRGLNEKCQKLKFLGIIFLKETRGPSPRVRGPRAAPVHGGPRSPSRRRLAGEWPERRPRARNLTAVEGKGEGTAVSLTGCKRGRWRVGHDQATVGNNWRRRRSVRWTLWTRKRAIEGGVSVVMAGGCSSPFYSGRGGAHQDGGGGNGRR